ncbi:MAG: sigma-70 family RNA polymerase sigma factor [Acidobacteriota bacterium]
MRHPDRKQPNPSWQDDKLVSACLAGSEQAWHALVDKYSQLVFAIARRYGASRDEATDLFQAVWLEAYNDLAKLRRKSRFKPWLITLAGHKCYHWKRKHLRQRSHEVGGFENDLPESTEAGEPALDERLATDQLVREGILQLPPRCREMIRLLFFTFPPKPYKAIAEQMGLATGSIGFIRGRCLERLQSILERSGL